VAVVALVLASDRLCATFPPCPVQKRNHLVATKCTFFTSPQPNCHHLHLLAVLAGLTDISKNNNSVADESQEIQETLGHQLVL
jgi:hypothetical protein